jgi:hypothetical protein
MPQDRFYLTPEWKAARRAALQRVGGVCQVPGCADRASVVDHIRPRRAGGAPFDPANLRPMCWRHHSAKTVRADGGFGRAPNPAAASRSYGADDRGLPLDPSHRWAAQRGAGVSGAASGVTGPAGVASGVPGPAGAGVSDHVARPAARGGVSPDRLQGQAPPRRRTANLATSMG